MLKQSLREGLAQVGVALREPEEFALRWDHSQDYAAAVWLALGLTAVSGTTLYGMTMGIGAGPAAIGTKSLLLTLGAGLAWAIPLPALYILNSLAGSRLKASTTLLAALVTTSWGGLARSPRSPSIGYSAWRFRHKLPNSTARKWPIGSCWRSICWCSPGWACR